MSKKAQTKTIVTNESLLVMEKTNPLVIPVMEGVIMEEQAEKTFHKELDKICNSFKTSREDLHNLARKTAVSILVNRSNVDRINILMARLESSLSEIAKKQLKEWFESYFPVQERISKKEDGSSRKTWRINLSKGTSDEDYGKLFNFLEAQENPWYTIKGMTRGEIERLFSLGSIQKRLEKLIKDANKAIKEGKLESLAEKEAIEQALVYVNQAESVVHNMAKEKPASPIALTPNSASEGEEKQAA